MGRDKLDRITTETLSTFIKLIINCLIALQTVLPHDLHREGPEAFFPRRGALATGRACLVRVQRNASQVRVVR
jgi:hypothetical protein